MRRAHSTALTDHLTELQLTAATSAKKPEWYTLYRGVRNTGHPKDGVYTDKYPSSWSTSEAVAKRFAGKTGALMCITVSYLQVLLDFDYLYQNNHGNPDSEHEVIVLPGKLKVDLIMAPERIVVAAVAVEGLQKELEQLKKTLEKMTMVKIKALCKEKKIRGYSKYRKAELVVWAAEKLLA